MKTLKIESIRVRLTLYYVSALAVALFIVGGLIYVLLARALYNRTDANLEALVQTARNSLQNDFAEGQDMDDAARSTAAELASQLQMLAIYDERGRLLAEEARDDDLNIALPHWRAFQPTKRCSSPSRKPATRTIGTAWLCDG